MERLIRLCCICSDTPKKKKYKHSQDIYKQEKINSGVTYKDDGLVSRIEEKKKYTIKDLTFSKISGEHIKFVGEYLELVPFSIEECVVFSN
jgi:hypothetical protein